MSQKRVQDDVKTPSSSSDCSTSDGRRSKRPSFRSVVMEVMKLRSFQNSLEPLLEHALEPFIRKVVKEEVESALQKHLTHLKWNCEKEMLPSESRSLQLQFLSSLSLPVFTGTRIVGEGCTTVKVALVDADTGNTVFSGVGSSAKVEIVVLDGDFDGDHGDNWTFEQFSNYIIREREGKKPLLTGDLFMNLNEGTGTIGDISFTDNSSWTRSRRFRLGARVVDKLDGVRVREALSEPFIVRDHRGELYRKHHPPYLLDEVWRLEKIAKEGAFHKRLIREKVTTVKDFLILLFLDPERLRNILGSGMSAKMWEVTVDHARKCVLDDKRLYLYCPGSQRSNGVVFNVVGQVVGKLSDSRLIQTDKLSESEKGDVQKLALFAFQHPSEIISYEDETAFNNAYSTLPDAFNHSSSQMSDCTKIVTSQTNCRMHFQSHVASSPDISPSLLSMGAMSSLDAYCLHSKDSLDVRFDQPSSSLICNPDFLAPPAHLHYFDTYPALSESHSDLQSAVNSFLFPRAGTDKAQRRWKILSSVLKWLSLMFELRRDTVKFSHPK